MGSTFGNDSLRMSELCFICLNSDCDWRNSSYQGNSYGRGRRKRGKVDDSSCSRAVKILTAYILQTSKASSKCDMDELQEHIFSSLGSGKFSICNDCLAKAKVLLSLHLELEKIQMQILDVLKGLQNYVAARKAVKVEELHLENDVMFSRFQDVLLRECRNEMNDLSDGTMVRMERLETMGFTSSALSALCNNVEDLEGVVGATMPRLRSKRAMNPISYVEVSIGDPDYSDDNYEDGGGEDFEVEDTSLFEGSMEPNVIITPSSNPIATNERRRGRPRNENPPRRRRGTLAWDCDICLEDIPFKQMNNHLKSHPEFEKFYKCEICPHVNWTRKYGTYKGLVWHYIRSNHHVQLPCKLCPDQSILFKKKELCKHLYDSHYQTHKKLQCKIDGCSEEFYEHLSLKSHRLQQHTEAMYPCHRCQKVFKTNAAKTKHIEKVHSEGEKMERFQCASCPKVFKTMGQLRQHEKTHEEGWVPKPKVFVQCPHCPKLVASLSTHIKHVHAEKSLICRFCGKTFSRNCHLKRHEDAHRGEKKFKCSKCSYAGTTAGSLGMHMRLHREKTFQCRYCPKAFPIKRYWEDHERTHTKEKPYQCDHCEMAFNARNMLSAHRRKKHGIAAVQQSIAGVGVTIMDEEEQEKCNYNKVEPCPEKIEFPQ